MLVGWGVGVLFWMFTFPSVSDGSVKGTEQFSGY